jgi:hypothetical protein
MWAVGAIDHEMHMPDSRVVLSTSLVHERCTEGEGAGGGPGG